MAEYLLLFRGGNTAAWQQSPENWQAQMQKWMEWMDALNKEGKLAGAQPLKPGGRVIKGTNKTVTDGPFTEGKEIIGGYLICRAASYGEAIELSQNCPILLFNDGVVEIREIQDMEM